MRRGGREKKKATAAKMARKRLNGEEESKSLSLHLTITVGVRILPDLPLVGL
jgi:hypothetical protein